MPQDINCSKCDQLRAALVGLIGADSREELEAMETTICFTLSAPGHDKTVALNAIHALLATLPATPVGAD